MKNEIKIITLPVIDYSVIDTVAEQVKEDLAKVNVSAIAPTEDSLTFLKKLRAEKNKQFKEYEDARKMIKKAVNDPYNLFNEAYEEKIVKQFKSFDEIVAKSINSVEDKMKQEREIALVAYFSSLITDEINFLTFDKIGLKVNLSDSMVSFKRTIESFVTKTLDDYNLIMAQENANRILVRYKQSLNVSQAITSVMNEVKQEEALAKREQEYTRTTIIEPAVDPIKQEQIKITEEDIAEVQAMKESDPVLTVKMVVTGKKSELIALKKYIEEELGLTLSY